MDRRERVLARLDVLPKELGDRRGSGERGDLVRLLACALRLLGAESQEGVVVGDAREFQPFMEIGEHRSHSDLAANDSLAWALAVLTDRLGQITAGSLLGR